MWNYHDNLDNYGLLTKYREVTEEEADAFNYISAINENHRTPFGKIFFVENKTIGKKILKLINR